MDVRLDKWAKCSLKGPFPTPAHVLFFPQQCTYIDNNNQPTKNGRLFNEFNASRKWKKSLLSCVPPSEFCCCSFSLFRHSHFLRARVEKSQACTLFSMCVFSFFSISHQSGTFPGCCTYILFCARRAHLVVVISPVIYGAIHLYPRRTSAVVFRTLSPQKIRPWQRARWEKGRRVDLHGDNWSFQRLSPPRLQTANFGVLFHHSDLFGQWGIKKITQGVDFFVKLVKMCEMVSIKKPFVVRKWSVRTLDWTWWMPSTKSALKAAAATRYKSK